MMHFSLPILAATGLLVAALSTSTSSPAPSASSSSATPVPASGAAVADTPQRPTHTLTLTRDRTRGVAQVQLEDAPVPNAAPEEEADASEATFDFEQCAVREISAYNAVRACMARIDDEQGRVEASEYVAAAECLKRGQLIAAAIEARTEAPKHNGELDSEANAAAIAVDQKQAVSLEKYALGKK